MGYQLIQKKLPLRKCMQCHKMKREAISSGRCQACYDANEMYENLIGWTDTTETIPGLNDYALYFLRWLTSRLSQRDRGPQGQSNTALIALMKAEEHEIGSTSSRLRSVARYYPASDLWEVAPYVKDEPLPVERGPIEQIACEVRYG